MHTQLPIQPLRRPDTLQVYSSAMILAIMTGLALLLGGCSDFYARLRGNSAPVVAVDHIETEHFALAEGQILVGQPAIIETRENDTLVDLARHFGLGLSEIEQANPGVDMWTPPAGQTVQLPVHFMLPDVPRRGVVINLPSMRLFRFETNEDGLSSVSTYPTGIGRDGWETPSGETRILRKTKNPVWHVPASILKEHREKGDPLPRVVKAGPDNPLGEYAMHLAIPSYLIHGTNKPYGVGLRISHGCIRLYPEDIARLFNQVDVNTPVNIIDQPYLAGWEDDTLYIEAHDPLVEDPEERKKLLQALLDRLSDLASGLDQQPSEAAVREIVKAAQGFPVALMSREGPVKDTRVVAVTHPGTLTGTLEIPAITETDWLLEVDHFQEASSARKLAAILNHQGPPIPSRLEPAEEGFLVVSGPFPDEKSALKVSARLQRDFEIQAKLVSPQ